MSDIETIWYISVFEMKNKSQLGKTRKPFIIWPDGDKKSFSAAKAILAEGDELRFLRGLDAQPVKGIAFETINFVGSPQKTQDREIYSEGLKMQRNNLRGSMFHQATFDFFDKLFLTDIMANGVILGNKRENIETTVADSYINSLMIESKDDNMYRQNAKLSNLRGDTLTLKGQFKEAIFKNLNYRVIDLTEASFDKAQILNTPYSSIVSSPHTHFKELHGNGEFPLLYNAIQAGKR